MKAMQHLMMQVTVPTWQAGEACISAFVATRMNAMQNLVVQVTVTTR